MPALNYANRHIEEQLCGLIKEIEKITDTDAIFYVGDITFGADDVIREAIEEIDNKRSGLTFLIETTGGFAETSRRISDVLRHHYTTVDFLVPNHAFSAGTILVMSGDSIWMDYYSVLGPIDPQVENQGSARLVPALGYLRQYERLQEKANKGTINAAELQILLSFDQGDLYAYEQAEKLSIALLKEWLVKYKFKNWLITETNKKSVTQQDKDERAEQIAKQLNNVEKWNSHGIGINMETLIKDVNVKIDDFGKDPKLNSAIRTYHRLLLDYMGKMAYAGAVHTRTGFEGLGRGA